MHRHTDARTDARLRARTGVLEQVDLVDQHTVRQRQLLPDQAQRRHLEASCRGGSGGGGGGAWGVVGSFLEGQGRVEPLGVADAEDGVEAELGLGGVVGVGRWVDVLVGVWGVGVCV